MSKRDRAATGKQNYHIPTFEVLTEYDIPRSIEMAMLFGIIIHGYTVEDYILHAALTEKGYETVVMWGLQGSGKSCRMLQFLFWIYRAVYVLDHGLTQWNKEMLNDLVEDQEYNDFLNALDDVQDHKLTPAQLVEVWDRVLAVLVFMPNEFIENLESLDMESGESYPALGWDDIGVHFPASRFKTDQDQYEAVDSTWAAIRTVCHVIIVTIPLIDRLAKNIRDNTTIEVFIGKNQMELINRCFRLPGTKNMESNFFKVIMEKPGIFDLYVVPKWVWVKYWGRRLLLTKEALGTLKKTVKSVNAEDYISIHDALELVYSQGIKYSASSMQSDGSRSLMRHAVINSLRHFHKKDFFLLLKAKGGYDPTDPAEVQRAENTRAALLASKDNEKKKKSG